MYRALRLFFLTISFAGGAQEGLNRQELFKLLETDPADSTRIEIYNELTWPVYSYDQPDSSIYYGEMAAELAEATGDKKRLAVAHRRLGITYINIGDIQKSLHHQEQSYNISEETGDKRGMLLALNNMGVAYLNNELLNTALGYFLRSLKITEEIKDHSIAPSLYANCGMIYRRTGDLERSKEYFLRAREFAATQSDTEMLVVANSNLSDAYRLLNNLDSSGHFLLEAEKFLTDATSPNTRFKYFHTRALLRSAEGQNEAALKDFIAMRSIVTVLNDEITLLINIAEEYLRTGNKEKAIEYFEKAYGLSEKNRMFNNLEYVSLALANIFQEKGNLQKFAFYIRRHLAYGDSNEQVNKMQQIQRQQLEYDYRRRRLADSIVFLQKERLNNLELAAAEERLSRARNTRIFLVAILIAFACVAAFVLNRFFVIRRQKMIIESQKQLVETKNEEILDSINYARRLQSAILPQITEIKRYMTADVLFLPKDIIGGDFYFFEKQKSRIYFAVCDCTGHGIPGALMSVVCYEALEKAIRTFRLKTPAEILDKAREIVINTLQARDQNIKDGMDCSLLMIDQLRETVQWAGANNGLWIVRNGELQEMRGDKQPVAFYENPKSFTNHQLQIEPGTALYLYTDGYADQFGGYGAKKYKNKTLKKFVTGISDRTVDEQVRLLRENFYNWKKELDQVDDVAIAIVKF